MKKFISSVMMMAVLVVSMLGCTTMESVGGAVVGGITGAAAGALLDRKNPFRGAIYGGALGATAGGLLMEMSTKATQEAVRKKETVGYRSRDGKQAVLAEYVGRNKQTKCERIRARKWENGQLIGDTEEEICKGRSLEAEY